MNCRLGWAERWLGRDEAGGATSIERAGHLLATSRALCAKVQVEHAGYYLWTKSRLTAGCLVVAGGRNKRDGSSSTGGGSRKREVAPTYT